MAASPLQGKDEVAGIAERGGEVLPALQHAAPGLTLQQLHKLTEHHHDDWAVGAPAAVNGPGSECHGNQLCASPSYRCRIAECIRDLSNVHSRGLALGSGHVGLWPGS